MLDLLADRWWALVIRGVAALVFGILALVWPELTLVVLVILVGVFFLVDGVFLVTGAISGAAQGHRWLPVFQGVLSLIFGGLVLLWPEVSALVLLMFIAAWALATGVVQIVTALRLRRELTGEWLLVLSGLLSVLFGIALLVWPAVGAIAVAWLIGCYVIVLGVMWFVLGLQLRRIRRQEKHQLAG
ncbi:HdeD family acid-resistance protein [Lipingzhangella sp. LS1_29]|uniref:HdeD family acid-resistance protein n=1 Tax=Lipingzhangella rawalii TaxID=2055835 RepID=A0ABU2H3W9_9ACTN|nr:HdeD family acid-resistance protein [Lipingzhangella rawalii]MDS1269996.1 HdeD family acid-resistance protein [Lipingzhangella rawalii]